MRVIFLAILSLFLFVGCADTSLRVSPKNIYANSCNIETDLAEISRSSHGGPLYINRYLFSDTKGNILVKERGVLDHTLVFVVGPISLMHAGFEFQKYSTHSLDNHHDFIEGIARDGEQIYILVQSLDEGFSIIYSSTLDLILPLANCLKKEDPIALNFATPKKSSNHVSAIKSDWSTPMFLKHSVARSVNFDEY
ncbi:MAG: hypothetical protein GX780_07230 [Campylobacteraceae bacterium]|nr:hypothetical protein [Campylobacteraceae bacterium]